MDLVSDAIVVAVTAHEGQLDKAGIPYIHHPLRVLELVRWQTSDMATLAAAVLHDVVEDTPLTFDQVASKLGFLLSSLQAKVNAGLPMSPEGSRVFAVIEVLDALTRREDETYEQYRNRALEDPRAELIKWADSTDNWARLHLVPGDSSGLRRRYEDTFRAMEESGTRRTARMRHAECFGAMVS